MLKLISFLVVMMSAQFLFSQSTESEIASLKKQLLEANENLRRAEAISRGNQINAERLRYQMVSMDLAEKSKVVYDKELAGLLALQAYRFNVKYGGYTFESRVFGALTEALNRFGYQHKGTGPYSSTEYTPSRFSIGSNPSGEILIRKNGTILGLPGHQAKVNIIKYDSSGKFMATADESGLILIWNMEDISKSPRSLKVTKPIKALDFSVDDTELRVLFSNESHNIWSISNERLATELEKFLTRNLSQNEWEFYTAPDIPRERTVPTRLWREN